MSCDDEARVEKVEVEEPDVSASAIAAGPSEPEPERRPPLLVIDVRERQLIDLLRSRFQPAAAAADPGSAPDDGTPTAAALSGCDLEVRRLDVGDAEIRGADGEVLLVVERKTLADLGASLRDGRYAEQRKRLTDAFGQGRVAYVLEGASGQSGFTFGDERKDVGGTSAARLQGAALSLMLGSARVPVVFTRDLSDTAAFLRRAAAFLTADRPTAAASGGYAGAACRASAVKKRDNVDPHQCYLQQLCQVPGVSYGLASALAARAGFGSMRELVATLDALPARERLKALQAVPKVGKMLSERIVLFLIGEGRPLP